MRIEHGEEVKSFLVNKLTELEKLMSERNDHPKTGKEKLEASVVEEVIDTVRNQMAKTEYFTRPESETSDKMAYAPLTNMGCESEFSKLDHRIKASGGSTSIQTHSRKNLLVSSGLLVDSSFESKSPEDRKTVWKWVRCSEEVKAVRKLETDFLETVNSAKKLALQKKEELKKKKAIKEFAVLEKCKQNGGPMTPNSLNLLSQLNENQLLAEISYLRLTVAPYIRQKRCVKVADGKYKMENLSRIELLTSIKNPLRPEVNVTKDTYNLLMNALIK